MSVFVIINRGETSDTATSLYAQGLTVNQDGSLSLQIGDTVRHVAAEEWDGISVLKYPDDRMRSVD